MAVKIIVGSTADVPKKVKERLIVVPLSVHFGDEEFMDGVTITHDEFYTKLENSLISPTTSQPSPMAFREKYEEVVKNGDSAVVITISSEFSGTYQSAVMGAKGLEDKVFVIDSKTASIGEGILVELLLSYHTLLINYLLLLKMYFLKIIVQQMVKISLLKKLIGGKLMDN